MQTRPVKYKHHNFYDKEYSIGRFHKFVTLPHGVYNDKTCNFEEKIAEFAVIEAEDGVVHHIHSTNIVFLDRDKEGEIGERERKDNIRDL